MAAPTDNISGAIRAYKTSLENTSPAGGGNSELQEDFLSLVNSAIKEARTIGERSEKLSLNAINDRADMTQVITAVTEAEMTLQTMVNVRDKVMESYQRILRMPI